MPESETRMLPSPIVFPSLQEAGTILHESGMQYDELAVAMASDRSACSGYAWCFFHYIRVLIFTRA